MPEVDLSFARQTYAETVLLDRCMVTRDAPGARAAVFDHETGDYVNALDESGTLAVDEPCKVTAQDDAIDALAPGRQRELSYMIGFAFGRLDDIAVGDRIKITASEDPRLVDQVLRVTEIVEQTLRVSRKVRAVRRASGDRSPE